MSIELKEINRANFMNVLVLQILGNCKLKMEKPLTYY